MTYGNSIIREPVIYDITDPLVIYGARKHFVPWIPHFMLNTIKKSGDKLECLQKAIGYYLAEVFDNPKQLGDILQFPPATDGQPWSNLGGRLVASFRGDIAPSGWTHGVHPALVRWAQSQRDVISWFRDSEGIPLLRLDESMNASIVALLKLDNGEHLWLAIKVLQKHEPFTQVEVTDGARFLRPDMLWTVKVSGYSLLFR